MEAQRGDRGQAAARPLQPPQKIPSLVESGQSSALIECYFLARSDSVLQVDAAGSSQGQSEAKEKEPKEPEVEAGKELREEPREEPAAEAEAGPRDLPSNAWKQNLSEREAEAEDAEDPEPEETKPKEAGSVHVAGSLLACLLGFGVPSGRPRTDSALYMWKSARPEVSQWDVVAEVQRLCQAEQRIRRLRTMLHGMPLCQYVIRSLVQCKVTARHQIVCLRVLAEVPAAKSWILLLARVWLCK